MNRLATATSSLGWGESYTYDGFGNLTDETVTAGSAPALHVTVDPTTNRLAGSAYTYDTNGNLTAVAGAFTATYNVNNKPYTISPSAGGTQVYYYDQNGDRGLIADGDSNIIGGGFYGAYGEHVSTGYLGSDSYASSDYIFFGTEPIWNSFVNSAGVTVYSEQVAQDRLGSVRLWGTQTTNLFPYGVEYTTTGQDHEKFATYIRDSFTGLDYARNRFYSSTLGRFTSADPSLSSVGLGNPLSWNRYAYVNGDPVNITDPSGLCSGGENMPNDASCLVSPGDEGSNSSNTAPDPNGTATDSNGNTVGVQVEGTSITVSDTPDPVNPYDASIPTAIQDTGIQGPVGTGGAADAPNNGPPNQNACTAPILNAVNNNYGTNFDPSNVQSTFTNGGAFNLNINGSGLPASQFNAIQTGRSPNGFWGAIIGYGPSLHITGPAALNPNAVFSNSNIGGATSVTFTAHIDSAWAYNPIGALLHYVIDVRGQATRNPCPHH